MQSRPVISKLESDQRSSNTDNAGFVNRILATPSLSKSSSEKEVRSSRQKRARASVTKLDSTGESEASSTGGINIGKSATTGNLQVAVDSSRKIPNRENASVTFSSTVDVVWDSMSRSSKSFKKLPEIALGYKAPSLLAAFFNLFVLFSVAIVTILATLMMLEVYSYTVRAVEDVSEISVPLLGTGETTLLKLPFKSEIVTSIVQLPFIPVRAFEHDGILRKFIGFENDEVALLVGFLLCSHSSSNSTTYGYDSVYCERQSPSLASDVDGTDEAIACTSYCMIPGGVGTTVRFEEKFKLEETLLFRSEHGFGSMEDMESIPTVYRKEGSTIYVQMNSYRSVVKDPVDWYTSKMLCFVICVLILHGIFIRILVLISLARGVLIRNYRVFIGYDVAGGLLTSPWAVAKTGFFYGMCIPILTVSGTLDIHHQTAFQLCCLSAAIASAVVLIMHSLSSFLVRRFQVSGMMIYLLSTIAASPKFLSNASELDLMVLGTATPFFDTATCQIGLVGASNKVNFNSTWACYTYYQPVKVGGLELLMTLYVRNVLVALGLVFFVEIFLQLYVKKKWRRNASGKVQPLSSFTGSWLSFHDKDYQSSSCENVMLLSSMGESKFNMLFTEGIQTVFGTYFHLASMIEHNQVRWGPLILNPNRYAWVILLTPILGSKKIVHFLIAAQAYSGVQTSDNHFRSVRQNGTSIPEYLRHYDYESISMFPDCNCLL